MENVIESIKKLFQDLSATLGISTDILLIACLGVLVLLLIILMIFGKKKPRPKKSSEGSDSGFLEVGPEPVIVYNRANKEKAPSPDSESPPLTKAEQDPLPLIQPNYDTEPQRETAWEPVPTPSAPTPEPASTSRPEPESPDFQFPKWEPEPIPSAAASNLSPFQQYMRAEPGQESAATFQPTLFQEPLPALESDFANEILLLFTREDFTVEKVAYHGTYGADFIVFAKGLRSYVQVKDWKKKATPRTVLEARYYANSNGCQKAILIPKAGYTGAANREAVQRTVILWNTRILKKIKEGQLSLEEGIAASSF